MSKITSTQLHLGEAASAGSSTAAQGQIWVKSDAPSSLYYTDDAGTDFRMGGITLGANTATTSGTSIDFLSIPSGVKEINIMFDGVSGSGTSEMLVQIGDASGGIENTGYESLTLEINSGGVTPDSATAGFIIESNASASNVYRGIITLLLKDSATFTWVESGRMGRSTTTQQASEGVKALSAELDRVRITHENGSDTFDAGSINISYS